MIKSLYNDALRLISAKYRTRSFVIILTLFIGSLLDFIGVASFLPVFFIIVQPGFATRNGVIGDLMDSFHFSETTVVLFLISLVVAFAILKNFISLWITSAKAKFSFNIGRDLSTRALDSYLQMPYAEFSNANLSNEIHRITNHPLAFANNIVLAGATILSESLIVIFILIGIAWYDPVVLGIVLAVILPIILISQAARQKIRNIGNELKERYPTTLKYGREAVDGFMEIRAFGREYFFKDRFSKAAERLSNTFVREHLLQVAVSRLSELMAVTVIATLVIYSVVSRQNNQEAVLLLSAYAAASFRIIPSLNRILHASLQIRTHGYVIHELKHLIQPVHKDVSERRTIEFKDKIELSNINFSYGHSEILQSLNLTIQKGEKIAITGESGEGKSTLLLLLVGLIKPKTGEVRVDNVLLPTKLAPLASYVSQTPYLIDGTIAQNIAFGIDDNKVNNAKLEQLIVDLNLREMIDRLPAGIHTNVGDKGIKLSGGQRQRIAIARALYTDPDLLLIDEGTSQLHIGAELEILNLLEGLSKKGKAIIVVTHRLSNMNFFDSIYNLKNGCLLEMVIPQ